MGEKRALLSVKSVSKAFDGASAADDISFAIAPGEIVGLVGPNGAGKTTIISIILGLLSADKGDVIINNAAVSSERKKALSFANFFGGYAPLPGNLSVYENLNIFGLLYGIPRRNERIKFLMEEFGLLGIKKRRVGVLSSGQQTKVGLAKALLNEPRLLLLDEPTSSLDPAVANEVRSLIVSYARRKGASVLWTSHNMNEIEGICDRILFLLNGRIILEGDPKALPSQYNQPSLEALFIEVSQKKGAGL